MMVCGDRLKETACMLQESHHQKAYEIQWEYSHQNNILLENILHSAYLVQDYILQPIYRPKGQLVYHLSHPFLCPHIAPSDPLSHARATPILYMITALCDSALHLA